MVSREDREAIANMATSEYFAGMYQLLTMYVPEQRLISHHIEVQKLVTSKIRNLTSSDFG